MTVRYILERKFTSLTHHELSRWQIWRTCDSLDEVREYIVEMSKRRDWNINSDFRLKKEEVTYVDLPWKEWLDGE